LFFSKSDAVLKIPSCVVRVLETDELGQLWFIIPKPSQFIHAFDKVFPVELDFFRKGRDYYLKIFGKAFMVFDPEEINQVECLDDTTRENVLTSEAILIRVQITSVDYSEKSTEKSHAKSLIHQVKSKLYHWFQMTQPESGHRIPVRIKYPSITSFTN